MKLERLRELREARGLTQVELAERAHASPVSVLRAEAGKEVKVTTARRYAKVLGVEVADLLEARPSPLAMA
jgi:transcriptional regulator with XRE-family HTH domain